MSIRDAIKVIHRVSKKQAKLFCHNYVKLPPNLTNFWHKDGK